MRSGVKWSGLNSSASGPQTLGSRCSIGVSTSTAAPLGKGYWPPMTVSANGYLVKPGAVGHSRSDSSRICLT